MTQIAKADEFVSRLGLEAYRVGGSVRDEIIGRKTKDADYVVRGVELHTLKAHCDAEVIRGNAKSATLIQLRDKRKVGVRVYVKGVGLLEIVLPRTERSTGPGHRDFEIIIDPELSLTEDAARRDFTFNALYKLLPDGPVADPTSSGLYDLQHKIVNTTHPDSFRDDPLRTLRALRFVSVLGFELGDKTFEEMQQHAQAVDGLTDKGVSGTALDELCKLLMGANVAEALRLMRNTGVMPVLLPELAAMIGFRQNSKYHDMTTDEHTFKALETAAHVNAPLRVRMALLFHDSGKPATQWIDGRGNAHYYKQATNAVSNAEIQEDHEVVGAQLASKALARLNAPSKLRKEVNTLVREHMVSTQGKIKGSKVRRMRVRLGDELLRDLFLMRTCDLSGKGGRKISYHQIGHIAEQEKLRQQAQQEGVPVSTKDLHINGNDALTFGLEGPAIGRALARVLDEVVVAPDTTRMSQDWQRDRLQTLARMELNEQDWDF